MWAWAFLPRAPSILGWLKHGGLIRRLFCVLVVVIVNSREIPCVNKKRRFWPGKSDTAMKSGYAVKTWYFPKARVRSPLVKNWPQEAVSV
jgi:hypothetical protein